MSVTPIRKKCVDLLNFSSFTSEDMFDALSVIMDSSFEPRNAEMMAFRYDSDLARALMKFVEQQELAN